MCLFVLNYWILISQKNGGKYQEQTVFGAREINKNQQNNQVFTIVLQYPAFYFYGGHKEATPYKDVGQRRRG